MMETIRDLIKKHEGIRLQPYRCSAGKLTIGAGHSIDAKGLPAPIKDYLSKHGEITMDMMETLLAMDIVDAERDCLKLYPLFHTFDHIRQNALIDFLLNVGYKTAATFVKANKAINKEDWPRAAQHLQDSLWYNQVGYRSKEVVAMILTGEVKNLKSKFLTKNQMKVTNSISKLIMTCF